MTATLLQEIGQATELSQALSDLDMIHICCGIDPRMNYDEASRFMQRYFCSDSEEIEQRLSMLCDLKALCSAASLQQIIDAILAMQTEQNKLHLAASRLPDVIYRWRLIAAYIHSIQMLDSLVSRSPQQPSARLRDLTALVKELQTDPLYARCQTVLQEMETLLPLPHYLTVGFNVREDGYPNEMGILSIENEQPPLNALLSHSDATQPSYGLGPEFVYNRSLYGSHFDEYITRNLEKQWKSSIHKAAKLLEPIKLSRLQDLLALAEPLHFYQVGLLFAEAFENRGYHLCRPELAGSAPGAHLEMKNVLYPDLILHSSGIQGNDLSLASGHAIIITGANHSGKTSYLKTIGQSYILAQLGFLVPADAMRFSPVTGMYSLFSAGEDSSMTASRMGVEIKKLSGILKQATSTDLVLLNEPMTSTNPVEAVSICADLSHHFLRRGITHLLVTHLYDIYFLLKAQLEPELKAKLESLITQSHYDPESGGMVHSYRLTAAEPLGNSYARETASAYGITLTDMLPQEGLRQEAEAYCQTHNINSIYEGEDAHGTTHNH